MFKGSRWPVEGGQEKQHEPRLCAELVVGVRGAAGFVFRIYSYCFPYKERQAVVPQSVGDRAEKQRVLGSSPSVDKT